MSMEDVWVETIHESERRAGKKHDGVSVSEDGQGNVMAMDTKKRPDANKDALTKEHRGQKKKRAA